MSEKNDGGPAFPVPYHPEQQWENPQGMTLRDYFAAKLIPAVWAEYRPINDYDCALTAYRIADAMLRAREA